MITLDILDILDALDTLDNLGTLNNVLLTTIIKEYICAYLEPEPLASIEHREAVGDIFQCSW